DAVEREGQALGNRAKIAADLVLRLRPVSVADDDEPPPPRTIVVRTFADQSEDPSLFRGGVSALRDPARGRARTPELSRRPRSFPEAPWRPGTAVPSREELAAAIERLRGLSGPTLVRRVEAILAGRFAESAAPS